VIVSKHLVANRNYTNHLTLINSNASLKTRETGRGGTDGVRGGSCFLPYRLDAVRILFKQRMTTPR
jgi:hypothetical protein